MKKVFLGGTCGSSWRDQLIPLLKIDYFNPVVDDWDASAQAEEKLQIAMCDFSLFVITPKMEGVFSIAEVVQCSTIRPTGTLFCVLPEDDGLEFTDGQMRSLGDVEGLVADNGALVFSSLANVAAYLNESYIEMVYNPNVLECMIKRDGDTEINIDKSSYVFQKNTIGDYVCEIISAAHKNHLLKTKNFRVYAENLAPEKNFTPEETDFLQRWAWLDADDFLAFINGHFEEFQSWSNKVRQVAIDKWRKLLPKMHCSLKIDKPAPKIETTPAPKIETIQETFPGPEPEPEPEKVSPELAEKEELTDWKKKKLEEKRMDILAKEMQPKDWKFLRSWKSLRPQYFIDFVLANQKKFAKLPEFGMIRAKFKWKKMVENQTGEPWPI